MNIDETLYWFTSRCSGNGSDWNGMEAAFAYPSPASILKCQWELYSTTPGLHRCFHSLPRYNNFATRQYPPSPFTWKYNRRDVEHLFINCNIRWVEGKSQEFSILVPCRNLPTNATLCLKGLISQALNCSLIWKLIQSHNWLSVQITEAKDLNS